MPPMVVMAFYHGKSLQHFCGTSSGVQIIVSIQRKAKLNTIITWQKVKVENCEKITKSLLDVLYFRLLVFAFQSFCSSAKKNLENLILTSFVEIYLYVLGYVHSFCLKFKIYFEIDTVPQRIKLCKL